MKLNLDNRILRSKSLPDIIAATLLVLVICMSVVITITRISDHREHHTGLASQATKQLKTNLEAELQEKTWVSHVFINNNGRLFKQLIDDPDNASLYENINQRLGRYFHDFYTFNIITDEHQLLVDNFDGKLGGARIADVAAFKQTGNTELKRHPDPNQFHFDVPVHINHDGTRHTVIVSFDFGKIAAHIRTAQPNDHKLYLVLKDKEHLIEVSEHGARNLMHQRTDFHMSGEEIDRILSERSISGTRWHVVDLYEPYLFAEFEELIRIKAAILCACMLLVISLIWNSLRQQLRHLIDEYEQLQEMTREIALQNRTLVQHSITDELTGLHNRRYFNDSSKLKWDMARRNQIDVTLVMIDIDFFKLYNDTYGHVAGDQCLQQVAKMIKKNYARSIDIVARYGGEEFVIMTSDNDFDESMQRARRLRESIEAMHIEHRSSTASDYVTVSCGLVHTLPSGNMTIKQLIDRADSAMYEAKQAGRNRLVACEDPKPGPRS